MKAVFISYNQILNDRVILIMDKLNIRGYSKWELTHGRGSVNGEPHMGSHAWPSMNSSVMTIIPDDKVEPFLDAIRRLDALAPAQGIRAFVWNIENQL